MGRIRNFIKSDAISSISPQKSLSTQRLFKIFFSAFFAYSEVNSSVSFLLDWPPSIQGGQTFQAALVLDAGNLAKEIETLRQQNIIYSKFKSALKKYRAIKADGSWEPVPEGPTLKKGMTDNRVLLLRKRLKITGDLPADSPDSEIFDDPLEQAAMRFQNRHHLTADGSVGKQTLAAFNVPVEDRIDQIKINLGGRDGCCRRSAASSSLSTLPAMKYLFTKMIRFYGPAAGTG